MSQASEVAKFLADRMNCAGDFGEIQVGKYQAVTFAAASPTGDGIVTVIVVPAAYAVRSEDDPLNQKLFPYP